MFTYSKKFILSRCLWWKPLQASIQICRHYSTTSSSSRSSGFPIDSATWDRLKSLGILRRFRGKRSTGSRVKNYSLNAVEPWISSKQDQYARSTLLTSIHREQNSLRGANHANLSIPLLIPFCNQVCKKSKLCILNSRSVCNKALLLNDFIVANEIDVLCITETWLKSNNQLIINELSPKGYIFQHVARKGRGGGIGILFKKALKPVKISLKNKFKSFEVMGMSLHSGSLLLVGEFNFHIEDTSNSNALKFLNILDCFNLQQHVDNPTYNDKHILDLVITRKNDQIVDNFSISDPAISDHSAVFCDLHLKRLLLRR